MKYSKQLLKLCQDKNYGEREAKELISKVDLNSPITDEKTTYLYTAVQHANIDMVRLLSEYGADPDFFCESDGPVLWGLQYPDFFEASEAELFDIAKVLLDNGATPNICWEGEILFDYIAYKVFNEIEDDDWEYLLKFFLYLVAYGGNTSYCSPRIYEDFDKSRLSEYKFVIAETDDKYLYGKIFRAGKLVAEI